MRLRIPLPAAIVCVAAAFQACFAAESRNPVGYVRDIKPILVKHCNNCHGAEQQDSGLRLDKLGLAVEGGDHGAAIVPGNSKGSLLFQAITGQGGVEPMPFEEPRLPDEDIDLIQRWIDQGAVAPETEYGDGRLRTESDHWSFQPIRAVKVPRVQTVAQIRNPIDAFILARLEQEGLRLSPEADQVTLIRRLHLSLLGLPPSIEDVSEFLADDQPGAYERLVNRLLSSPHYGEQWGRHWLDVARYADSNGFTIDGPRSIWKYRDWVINAVNADLPFDQFVIEQLAGDLLPDATRDQIVASGFHRNTLINQEGGTNDEQFRVEAIVDRVSTTGTAFLGLTVGCAQCHQHKYDPISQKEFYQFFAFFNNTEDINEVGPELPLPTAAQVVFQEKLRGESTIAEELLRDHDATNADDQQVWEQCLAQLPGVKWSVLEPFEFHSEAGAMIDRQPGHALIVGQNGNIPGKDTYVVTANIDIDKVTALRLELLSSANLPGNGPGLADDGNFVLSEFRVFTVALDADGKPVGSPAPVELAHCVADWSQQGFSAAQSIDGNPKTGWSIGVKEGQGSLNVDREAIFLTSRDVDASGGMRLTFRIEQLHGTPKHLLGQFRISVTSDAVDDRITPESVRRLVTVDREKRTAEQQVVLKAAYALSDLGRRELADRLNELTRLQSELVQAIPTTMVLQEREDRRETHVMIRGDFLRKGAKVRADVPGVLPPLPEDITDPTRLDLARWLVAADNPLTARVTVNRHWQRFFGLGLVETENDFGLQGIEPSHPDLLDWLAADFQRLGWSVKSLHRLIVTSATFRQSSRVSAEMLEWDQGNKLMARQSRLRLQAENVRDVWLAASGLLSRNIGGPGVYPPQPSGINLLTQVSKEWPESQGNARYRRGMYIYFWRSNPYPFLATFDVPNATASCTRRARSNTPLQALTLANDRTFVEIAKGLAGRVMRDGPQADEGRLQYAFRLCLSREPNEYEHSRLMTFLKRQRGLFAHYGQLGHTAAPGGFLPERGELGGIVGSSNVGRPDNVSETDENPSNKDELRETAAWTAVARVLLNLDEFITRE